MSAHPGTFGAADAGADGTSWHIAPLLDGTFRHIGNVICRPDSDKRTSRVRSGGSLRPERSPGSDRADSATRRSRSVPLARATQLDHEIGVSAPLVPRFAPHPAWVF